MQDSRTLSLLDRPALVSLVVLLIVLLAARIIIDFDAKSLAISVDASIESLLPSEGSALEVYEDVRQKFVGDDFVVAVWVSDTLFSADTLRRFKEFTKALEKQEDVVRVDSLATATYVSAEDDFTNIDDFLAELPVDDAAAMQLKKKALNNPLFAGQLVSKDGRGLLVAILRQA